MSEGTNCNRGCPTEDGWYIVLTAAGERVIERRFGVFSNGWAASQILAHRKHVPLEVPPLRELPKHGGVPCVVRFQGEICYGSKLPFLNSEGKPSSWILLVHTGTGVYWTGFHSSTTELTKEQCIAEGYRWPLGDCK